MASASQVGRAGRPRNAVWRYRTGYYAADATAQWQLTDFGAAGSAALTAHAVPEESNSAAGVAEAIGASR
jgi:hypothetical protein